MPLNYQNIKDNSLSKGIDRHSSEGDITPGYADDILNADLTGRGISKRTGYEVHAGELPLKVASIEGTGTGPGGGATYEIICDADVNFEAQSFFRRISVYGRTTLNDGVFSSTGINEIFFTTVLSVSGNTLSLEGPAGVGSGIDTSPELFLYGYSRNLVYANTPARQRVSFLDRYERAGSETLIAGVDGNLFSRVIINDTLYTGIAGTVVTTQTLGPIFWTTGDTPSKTNPFVTVDLITTNFLRINSATYSTDLGGIVRYELNAPGWAVSSGTLADAIPIGMRLSIQGMARSVHNGEFRIVEITSTASTITIGVTNSSITNSYEDEAETGGEAGVFSDYFRYTGTDRTFWVGDTLKGTDIVDIDDFTVISDNFTPTGNLTMLISNVTSLKTFTDTNLISADRTTRFLRTYYDAALSIRTLPLDISVYEKSLWYFDQDGERITEKVEKFQIADTSSLSLAPISVIGDGTEVTVAFASSVGYLTGDYIYLTGCGELSGAHLITSDNSGGGLFASVVKFSSDVVVSLTGGFIQAASHFMQMGRAAEFKTAAPGVLITNEYRWNPILPHDRIASEIQPGEITRESYHSIEANDSLFATGDLDAYHRKFDGTNVSMIGLPRYPCHAVATLDALSSSQIDPGFTSSTISGSPTPGANTITLTTVAQAARFSVGDEVVIRADRASSNYEFRVLSDSRLTFTVIDTDATTGVITFDKNIGTFAFLGGETYFLTTVARYRYYVRLTLIDANDNIIASPNLGSEDLSIQMVEPAGIWLKGPVFPETFEEYDYQRITVDIYRTKVNEVDTFYKIVSLKLADYDQYWRFLDATPDIALTTAMLDPVPTTGVGDLGVLRSPPLKAKYITSINNRTVYGNLKDHKRLNVVISRNADQASPVFVNVDFKIEETNLSTSFTYTTSSESRNVSIIASVLNTSFDIRLSAAPGTSDLAAGDWIYIAEPNAGTSDGSATNIDPLFFGWWQIDTVVVPNSDYRILYTGSPSFGSIPTNALQAGLLRGYFVDAGVTTRGPFKLPLIGNVYGLPDSEPYLLQNINLDLGLFFHLASAINRSMGTLNDPFCVAEAGFNYERSTLILTVPKNIVGEVEFTHTNSFGAAPGYDIFANGIKLSNGETVTASQKLYPNRLLISFANFSENFDNVTAQSQNSSASVIDVDPNDGDEITGIIPFFGSATFGAAQKTNVLVVFKKRSIFVVDTEAKFAGSTDFIKRLETRGKGGDSSFSLLTTKYGIFFANLTGVYVLQRDMSLFYIGQRIERLWQKDLLDSTQITKVSASNDKVTNRYIISVPNKDETENTDAFVFHDKDDGQDSDGWTRYDNIPAIMWATLNGSTFFASSEGVVYRLRRENRSTDYRDDEAPINTEIITASNHFGDPNTRKKVKRAVAFYRTEEDQNAGETQLQYSLDLQQNLRNVSDFVILGSDDKTLSSVGDEARTDERAIGHTLPVPKCNYLKLKFIHNVVNKGLELVRLFYKVAPLRTRAWRQASQTKDDS